MMDTFLVVKGLPPSPDSGVTLFPVRRALELRLLRPEQIDECLREQERARLEGRDFSNDRAGRPGDLAPALDIHPRHVEAEEDDTAALRINPRSDDALLGRGLARQALGDSAGAGADLEAALACTDPSFSGEDAARAALAALRRAP